VAASQQSLSNIKKVILLVSTLTLWQCAAKYYHLYNICCFNAVMQPLKSDMVVVLAVLPRYPRYYHGNGYSLFGITTVLGPKYMVFPWGWGPVLWYYCGYGVGLFSRT